MSYTQDVTPEDVVALLEALWLQLNPDRHNEAHRELQDIAARHT